MAKFDAVQYDFYFSSFVFVLNQMLLGYPFFYLLYLSIAYLTVANLVVARLGISVY